MPTCRDIQLAATVLVPQKTSTGEVTAEVALYNMLPTAYCPSELAGRSVNSMLGEVTGRQLPIAFATDASGALVASGVRGTAKVLSSQLVCRSSVLITDGVLLPPPPSGAGPTSPLPALRLPPRLPTSVNRHLTCSPVVYNGTDSGNSAADSGSTSSGGGSNALTIGLAVGLSCGAVALALAVFAAWRVRRGRSPPYVDSKVSPPVSSEPGSSDSASLSAPAAHYTARAPVPDAPQPLAVGAVDSPAALVAVSAAAAPPTDSGTHTQATPPSE